jgi:hypothetical protein
MLIITYVQSTSVFLLVFIGESPLPVVSREKRVQGLKLKNKIPSIFLSLHLLEAWLLLRRVIQNLYKKMNKAPILSLEPMILTSDDCWDIVSEDSTVIDSTYFYEVLSCGIQCECGGSVSTEYLSRHVHWDEIVSYGHPSIIQGRVPV